MKSPRPPITWIVGIGRYWDNPRANLFQHLGLGSVVYVIALSALLWLLVAPLRPPRWSFRQVLVFVTLCSPPALLYAIPVEKFVSLPTAQSINAWFLGIVAAWRVLLLFVFLTRGAGLSIVATVIGALLPVALIILALTALNLEHVVFSLMAGIAPEQRSPAELSYGIVFLLSVFSVVLSPILLIGYVVLVIRAWMQRGG